MIEALDPDRYEAVTVEIGRDGRWELGAGEARARRAARAAASVRDETLPVPARGERRAGARSASVDVVFPVLHGPFGEDGTVQGLLELAGVPVRRRRRRGLGALHGQGPDQGGACATAASRSTRNVTLRPGDALENPFGFPVFVKPARLGSSVGIARRTTTRSSRARSSSRSATTRRC